MFGCEDEVDGEGASTYSITVGYDRTSSVICLSYFNMGQIWLNNNIPQLSLPVRFGDELEFCCLVNASDLQQENLIGLRDEQEVNESWTDTTAEYTHGCDILLHVTNSPLQATKPFRFKAVLAYFTSFYKLYRIYNCIIQSLHC